MLPGKEHSEAQPVLSQNLGQVSGDRNGGFLGIDKGVRQSSEFSCPRTPAPRAGDREDSAESGD